MSTQIPLIETEVMPAQSWSLPQGHDIYLLSAYCKTWGWQLRRTTGLEEYLSLEAAEAAAANLPAMWIHIEIHHLRIGGGK